MMKLNVFAAMALGSSMLTPVMAQIPASNGAPAAPTSAGPASAGSAQDSAAAAAAATGDIVVTAQRRSERLVEVPITINSVPAKQLQSAGIRTTLDLYKVAPAVQVTHNGVWTEPAIRGVTTRVGENSVATYVDGIYNPSKISANAEFSDVERVDVLKGPQGTLFGRNATGGAILLTTRTPSQDLQMNMTGELEERHGRAINGYVSNGLTDNLAFSLSGYYRKSNGWIREGVDPTGNQPLAAGTPLNPVERSGVRGKLYWTPGDTTKITLTGEHGFLSDVGAVIYSAQQNNLLLPGVLPVVRDEAFVNQVPQNTAKWDAASLKIEHEFGDVNFTSTSAYRRERNNISVDVDQTPLVAPNIVASWDSLDKTLSQEFNLNYSTDKITVVAGLFLYRDKFYKLYVGQNAKQNVTAAAPYADVTYHITDKFSVIGGLRFSYEKHKFIYRDPAVGDPAVAFDSSRSYKNLSPRVVAKYDFSRNANVYASWSRGFKSGLYNTDATGLTSPHDLAAQALEPEKLDAFEVGYKMADHAFTLSTAAYYYLWKNIQVSQYVNGNTIYQNAASAHIWGVEANVGIRLSSTLNISANGAYTHARYSSFPDAFALVPSVAGDPNSALIPGVQDVSGGRLIRSPDWSGNLSLDYRLPTPIGEFEFVPNVSYSSKFSPDVLHLDSVTGKADRVVPGRVLVSTDLTYAPTDHIKVGVYVRNLFDKKYYTDLDITQLGYFGVWGEPRTVGFRVSYKY